ncbi:PqqD family protein [Romboutsia maritimum]|uniref:PqqD family protein n=1 Tax=Romboutsia maritimum TaxID=2020948 RepID=A0A371ITK3_9FIRM|nr:PqqD family protein [Romboutsia maritimum]
MFISKFKRNNKNYLDFIPIINSKIDWSINENDLVVLELKRSGTFDKFAQKLFKVPQKSDIQLDKQGSFVWKCINNEKTVYDISKEVSNEFGKDAEPLLDRLISYFNILNDNKFIKFNKNGKSNV